MPRCPRCTKSGIAAGQCKQYGRGGLQIFPCPTSRSSRFRPGNDEPDEYPIVDICDPVIPLGDLASDQEAYDEHKFGDHWDTTYGAIPQWDRSGERLIVPGSEVRDADGDVISVQHFDQAGGPPHEHSHADHADRAGESWYDYDMVHMYRYHHELFDEYYLADRGFRHRRGCRHGVTRTYDTPLPPRDTSPDYDNPRFAIGKDDDHWDSTYGAIPWWGRFGWWVQTLRHKVLDANGVETGGVYHYDDDGGYHVFYPGSDEDNMIHMYQHHHDVFDHYYLEDRGFKHRGGPHHADR